MKKIQIAFVCGALFVGVALAQTRSESWDAAGVTVEEIHLVPLSDGGCLANWCGSVVGVNGTVARDCTGVKTLTANLNQNRCQGLANAGTGRLQSTLNFAVDSGAP